MQLRTMTARQFALRCAIVISIIACAFLLWHAANVLMLVFGGIVVAVALRSLTGFAARHTPISERWALPLVVMLLLCAVVGLGALIGAHLAEQFGLLVQTVKEAWSQVYAGLEKTGIGRAFLKAGTETAAASSGSPLALAATSSARALADFVLILLMGVFLAAEPGLYRRGVLRVTSRDRRAGALRVLDALGVALTHWLLGTLIAMLTVGALTSLGLWLLNVPLSLSLGILAGLAEFVPFLGPIASAVPAVLVAFTSGSLLALETAGLYLVIHGIEAYLLVPLIQRRAAALAPALGIAAVVFFGLILGPLGVVFAHPLTICAMVLVKELCAEPQFPVP